MARAFDNPPPQIQLKNLDITLCVLKNMLFGGSLETLLELTAADQGI